MSLPFLGTSFSSTCMSWEHFLFPAVALNSAIVFFPPVVFHLSGQYATHRCQPRERDSIETCKWWGTSKPKPGHSIWVGYRKGHYSLLAYDNRCTTLQVRNCLVLGSRVFIVCQFKGTGFGARHCQVQIQAHDLPDVPNATRSKCVCFSFLSVINNNQQHNCSSTFIKDDKGSVDCAWLALNKWFLRGLLSSLLGPPHMWVTPELCSSGILYRTREPGF